MGCWYTHSFWSPEWVSRKDPGIPQKERGGKDFELLLSLSLCQQINEWARYLPWELQMTHHFVILNKLLGSFPAFDFYSRKIETPSEQFDNTVVECSAQVHHNSFSPTRDGRKSVGKWLCILDSNNYTVPSKVTDKMKKDGMPCMESCNYIFLLSESSHFAAQLLLHMQWPRALLDHS